MAVVGPVSVPPIAAGTSPFHMKGTIFSSLPEFFEHRIPGGFAGLTAAADDENLQAFLRTPFNAAIWYDAFTMRPICELAGHLMGKSFEDVCRELSAWTSERDIHGIYKVLLRLASPERVVRNLPSAGKRYFDFLVTEVKQVDEHAWKAFPRQVPFYLAKLYALMSETFIRRAVTLAGARNLVIETSQPIDDGMLHSQPAVRFERLIRWDP